MLGTWAGSTAVPQLLVWGCSLSVIDCVLGLGRDELEPVFLALPQVWLAIPSLPFSQQPLPSGAEAGQAEPDGQAAVGRAACTPTLRGQGMQSLVPPCMAFPTLLPPKK